MKVLPHCRQPFYYERLVIRIVLPRNEFFLNLTFKHDYQLFRSDLLLFVSLFQGTFCLFVHFFKGLFVVFASLFQGTFVQRYTFFYPNNKFSMCDKLPYNKLLVFLLDIAL